MLSENTHDFLVFLLLSALLFLLVKYLPIHQMEKIAYMILLSHQVDSSVSSYMSDDNSLESCSSRLIFVVSYEDSYSIFDSGVPTSDIFP